MDVCVGGALAHAENRGLRTHSEELEDGEHAARRDVVAVDEAERVLHSLAFVSALDRVCVGVCGCTLR
jgi:hypothetical protein